MIVSFHLSCVFMSGDLKNPLHIGIRPVINALHQAGHKIVVWCEDSQKKEVSNALKSNLLKFDCINRLPVQSSFFHSEALVSVTSTPKQNYSLELMEYLFETIGIDRETLSYWVEVNNNQEPELIDSLCKVKI